MIGNRAEFVSRLLVAVVVGGAFVALLFWSSETVWKLVTLAIIAVATWEAAALLGIRSPGSWAYIVAVLAICLSADFLLSENVDGSAGLFALVTIFWIMLAPVWLLVRRRKFPRPILSVISGVLLASSWYAMMELFRLDRDFLLAIMVLIWMIDIAGYVVGRGWGELKLSTYVSPNKTWEGLFGMLMVAYAFGLILWLHDSSRPLLAYLLASTSLAALSVLGDLSQSMLKRQAGKSDSGVILGGHGGLLDRIDSALPVLPFAALLPSYFDALL